MRKGNFKILQYFFLFHLLPGAEGMLFAQQPEFTARISEAKVPQHSVFEIQFELQNASGSDFNPPSFQDFTVVGGPSIGSSTMIVNGAVSRSQSWSYSLLAKKQGQFTIGAATVVAGRKKLSTRALVIEVVPPKDLNQQGSTSTSREPVFLTAEVDAKQYYPGQQIILTYRLLFRENVQTVSTLSEDDYADFFIQNFSDFSREATYETINGLRFTARIVKSLALFAHQSGTYIIDPMVMNAGINAPFAGSQGFFAMRRIQDIQVASEPLTIKVLPLPPDSPQNFSGAVGEYQVQMKAGKTEITTDDAFAFQLEITGNGDSRRWDLPTPEVNGNFETYDPKILEDKVYDAGAEVAHLRSIAYQMIPDTVGDYSVYVPFTYFDPLRKQYVTINSDTLAIHVTQGTGISRDSLMLTQGESVVPQLMAVRSNLLKDKFWVSFPHLFLFSLLLAGSGLSVFYYMKRRREGLLSDAEKIRLDAARLARNQYDLLESKAQTLASNVFFEKATETYYRFLMDRFMIPSSELDEVNLNSYMEKAGVQKTTLDRATRFFNQCLSVRYGGIPGGFTREEMLLECRELTSLLE